jgi:sigma-B regulation protein RsbU (phosphoserine phosphatase)
VIGAGHPPLILVSRAGVAQVVELESDPLGAFGTAILRRLDVRVSSGDRFFMYSDGLIEAAPGGSRREGLELLVGACVRHRSCALGKAVDAIVRELRPEGQTVEDDLLLMAADVGE